ncbi:MAG TPA: trypsin-like peptidase domain-containing protein [Polyangiales bacterium]
MSSQLEPRDSFPGSAPPTQSARAPAARPTAAERRLRLWIRLLGLLVAALLVAVAALSYRTYRLESFVLPANVPELAAPRPITPRGDLSSAEKSRIQLFRNTWKSVVHITTLDVRQDPFHANVLEVPKGTGSGFIWDAHGHIVTNFHVISGADEARVTLADHSEWRARLVGQSARNDVAVLRIVGAAKRLAPLPLGTSRNLIVGQDVFAIGSPFGLDYTLSTGVISGLGREIKGAAGLPIRGVVQTDAAINPGNSGGPLLDSAGRLIGMNTAIVSPSGASAGVGFAIPVDTVARVVPELISYGREVRPVIGVELADDTLAERLGLDGVLVVRVAAGSPAEQVGILPTRRDAATGEIVLGDVITQLAGTPVHNNADLYLQLEKLHPKDAVTLTLSRAGAVRTVSLVLSDNVSQ